MRFFVSCLCVAGVAASFGTTLNLAMVADDTFEAYISTSDAVQGVLVTQQSGTWQNGTTTGSVVLTPNVTHYLHVRARDVFGAPSMLVGQLSLSDANFQFVNSTQSLLTNSTDWTLSLTGFGVNDLTPTVIGNNGTGPWGTQGSISLSAERIWSTQTSGEHYFTTRIDAVPEPATLALLGLVAVAIRRRR